MRADEIFERLGAGPAVFAALTAGVGAAQARWRPAPAAWSIVEVINHLVDEEVGDFRPRLRLTLEAPEAPWPPIDPEGWVSTGDYRARDLAESVARLRREREISVDWLRGLGPVPWERVHLHPRLGPIRAGDLLTSWLAHDLIHVRQITRLHRAHLEGVLSPFSPEYAGPW